MPLKTKNVLYSFLATLIVLFYWLGRAGNTVVCPAGSAQSTETVFTAERVRDRNVADYSKPSVGVEGVVII